MYTWRLVSCISRAYCTCTMHKNNWYIIVIVIIVIIMIMTRSVQPWYPAVAICRQNDLSSASSRASVGHRNSRVPADLMNPGGGRSTSSTPPVGRRPDTILSLAVRSRSEGSGLLLGRPLCNPSIRLRKMEEAQSRPVRHHWRRKRTI